MFFIHIITEIIMQLSYHPKIYITIVSISPGGYYSCPKRIEGNRWGCAINGQYLRSPGEPYSATQQFFSVVTQRCVTTLKTAV